MCTPFIQMVPKSHIKTMKTKILHSSKFKIHLRFMLIWDLCSKRSHYRKLATAQRARGTSSRWGGPEATTKPSGPHKWVLTKWAEKHVTCTPLKTGDLLVDLGSESLWDLSESHDIPKPGIGQNWFTARCCAEPFATLWFCWISTLFAAIFFKCCPFPSQFILIKFIFLFPWHSVEFLHFLVWISCLAPFLNGLFHNNRPLERSIMVRLDLLFTRSCFFWRISHLSLTSHFKGSSPAFSIHLSRFLFLIHFWFVHGEYHISRVRSSCRFPFLLVLCVIAVLIFTMPGFPMDNAMELGEFWVLRGVFICSGRKSTTSSCLFLNLESFGWF